MLLDLLGGTWEDGIRAGGWAGADVVELDGQEQVREPRQTETPAKALAAPLRQRSNKRSQSMNPPPPFSPPPLAQRISPCGISPCKKRMEHRRRLRLVGAQPGGYPLRRGTARARFEGERWQGSLEMGLVLRDEEAGEEMLPGGGRS